MNPSKLLVFAVALFIFAGVSAWSWVNFTQRTTHDPTVAHRYLQHFDRLCPLQYEHQQACDQAIGTYHRRCFDDHLQPTPPELLDKKGPVLYDRSAYMSCMRQGVESILSTTEQHAGLVKQHDGDSK